MSAKLVACGLALAGAYRSAIGEQAARCLPDVEPDAARDRAAWTALIGVVDHDAARSLYASRIGLDALTALVQVPLLDVCWRSASGGPQMRSALREVADTLGFATEDPGVELLLCSAHAANADEVVARWTQLIQVLVGTLQPDALSALQWEVMNRAWLMATALHGPDASRWPKPVFAALRELECAFYEAATPG